MRCLGCDYALDHLTELRCPECGREFDPFDGRTYWTIDQPRHAMLSPRQLFIFAIVTLALDFAVYAMSRYGPLSFGRQSLSLCSVPMVIILLHVALLSYTVVALVEDRKRRWGILLFALLVAMWPTPFIIVFFISRFTLC